MGVAGVSIVIAAASVVAASTFYSLQIRTLQRARKTDLLMGLYTTWDSLEFQRAFHTVYWADFHDYDSAMAITGGERQLWTYLLSFYDQVGVLLRRRLIEFDMVDDLLGNSARQLWRKVAPMIGEARERYDPRLYEHFEFLYDEMTRRTVPVHRAMASSAGTGPRSEAFGHNWARGFSSTARRSRRR